MTTRSSDQRTEPRAGAKRLGRSRVDLAFRRLGGKKLLGVEVRAESDFLEVLRHGVPLAALNELARQQELSADEVDRLIVRRRTLAHRRARAEPLSRVESERALRVASIAALAEETFANPDKAKAWLRRPTSALGGERPLDLLDSEPGGRIVEQLLDRIAHGIAA